MDILPSVLVAVFFRTRLFNFPIVLHDCSLLVTANSRKILVIRMRSEDIEYMAN